MTDARTFAHLIVPMLMHEDMRHWQFERVMRRQQFRADIADVGPSTLVFMLDAEREKVEKAGRTMVFSGVLYMFWSVLLRNYNVPLTFCGLCKTQKIANYVIWTSKSEVVATRFMLRHVTFAHSCIWNPSKLIRRRGTTAIYLLQMLSQKSIPNALRSLFNKAMY
ncbi:hypothetical protein OE88DRAFT_1666147 [Heliocybe sulcata]|uniref:Uncharacterized protein n=1 Tax=Heliocybe sulcata TaxID=5364 RepID=A0A5C3N0X5_9AGAM|nr:hypothetical protein OE88DRAFT_1666147 [Heliocybe sulcata]